jgi:hypothetical protein
MEKNHVVCEALQQFIQNHCKNCQDAHCFGPACVESTGKCPVMFGGQSVDIGVSENPLTL